MITMFMHEHVAWMMAKERLAEASRRAEEARALSFVRGPHRSVRVRLGTALVRLGHRIMGQGAPDVRCRCEVGAASS